MVGFKVWAFPSESATRIFKQVYSTLSSGSFLRKFSLRDSYYRILRKLEAPAGIYSSF